MPWTGKDDIPWARSGPQGREPDRCGGVFRPAEQKKKKEKKRKAAQAAGKENN